MLIYCRTGPVFANDQKIIEHCNGLYYISDALQTNTTFRHLKNTPKTFYATLHKYRWVADNLNKNHFFNSLSDESPAWLNVTAEFLGNVIDGAGDACIWVKDLVVEGFWFLFNLLFGGVVELLKTLLYIFLTVFVIYVIINLIGCLRKLI